MGAATRGGQCDISGHRHRLEHGARGFAAAIPSDDDICTQFASGSRVREEKNRPAASEHNVLCQPSRKPYAVALDIRLADDRKIRTPRLRDGCIDRVAARDMPSPPPPPCNNAAPCPGYSPTALAPCCVPSNSRVGPGVRALRRRAVHQENAAFVEKVYCPLSRSLRRFISFPTDTSAVPVPGRITVLRSGATYE